MRLSHRLLAAGFVAAAVAISSPVTAGHVEKFDLSELADGERREFESGDRTVVAERSGEVVTITMHGDEVDGRTFECRVGEDRCIIMTINDDEGDKMKMMFMRRDGDETDIEHDVIVKRFGHGDDDAEGKHMVVTTHVSGEDGEHKVIEKKVRMVGGDGEVVWHGDHDGGAVFVHEAGGPVAFETISDGGAHMVFVGKGHDDKVMLRCPEGDTHMRVDTAEADVRYECPKHGVVLEKDEHKPHVMKKRTWREKVSEEN